MEQKGITPEQMKAAMRESAKKSLEAAGPQGTDDRAKLERILAEMTIRAEKHLKAAAKEDSTADYGAALELTYMVEFGLLLLGE